MKSPRLLLLVLAAFLAVLSPRPAQARIQVSFDFFYDSLASHGDWIDVGGYGMCWRPGNVDRDWAPYADGYWAYTDAGWTWVSYEEYGDIVYHYGRWTRLEDEGWCWVPEYEWAPAWVSWRESDDYLGWAPLPPEARWNRGIGISIWADSHYDIGPGYYNFCRTRDFGSPFLRPVIINRYENVTIIHKTVNITNITYNTNYNGGVIYNGGPRYSAINARSTRTVPRLKLVQENEEAFGRRRGDGAQGMRARVEGNQLVVAAPRVAPPTDLEEIKKRAKRTVAAGKVARGWSEVKDPGKKNELKQAMERQSRGLTPETAPARGVTAADLEDVPKKGNPKAKSPLAVGRGTSDSKPGEEKPAARGADPVTTTNKTAEKKAGEDGNTKPKARGVEMKPFKPEGEDERKTATISQPPRMSTPSEKKSTDSSRDRNEPPPVVKSADAKRATEARQEEDNHRKNMQAELAREARQKAEMQQQRSAREAAMERSKNQEQAAEQQRRQQQQMEAQRRSQEASREQMKRAEDQQRSRSEANEQARRAQDAQRKQMEVQRQAPEVQRMVPPPPPQTSGDGRKRGQVTEEEKKR